MDLPALSESRNVEGLLVEKEADQEMLRHLLRYIANQTSRGTQKIYSSDVRQFLAWCRERFGMAHLEELSRFTDDHAALYLNHLLQQGKPETVNRKLSALSQLFQELWRKRVIQENPWERVKRPRVDHGRGKTPGLTRDEVVALLDQPDLTTRVGFRDYVLLCMLFNLGLRASELVAINAEDFFQHFGHTLVKVRRKGNQEIPTKVPVPLHRAIRAYIERYGIHGYLFTCRAHNAAYIGQRLGADLSERPISTRSVWYLLKKYARRAGLDWRNLKPHSARVFFINEVVEQSRGDLEKAQVAAGHRHISTTQRYRRRKEDFDDHAVDYVRIPVRVVG